MNEGLSWQEAFEPWIWPSTLAHFHSRKCFSYNKFSIPITIHVTLLPLLCVGTQERGKLSGCPPGCSQPTLLTIQLVKTWVEPQKAITRTGCGATSQPCGVAHRLSSGSFTPLCPKAADPHTPTRAQTHREGPRGPGAHLLQETWVHRRTRGASARPRSFVAKCFPGRSWPSP